MAPSQVNSWASTSFASGGQHRGRVVSIADPEGRNRVQVRLHFYQDGIESSKLEWIHVSEGNAQMAGASRTHPYYVGSQVLINDSGTERYIGGAVAGFDSDKREQRNVDSQTADTSEDKNPDVPNMQHMNDQSERKDTSIRSSPGMQNKKGAGGTTVFDYPNFQKMFKDYFPYSLGRGGEKPAPFGEGTKSKLDGFMSMGNLKSKMKEDVLDVIDKMDNNLSGSIQASTKIMRALRDNGFTQAGMGTIGAGNVSAGDSEFNGKFGTGSHLAIDLIGLLERLIEAIRFINTINGSNIIASIPRLLGIHTLFNNPLLEVDVAILDAIQAQIDRLLAVGVGSQPIAFYEAEAIKTRSLFLPGFIKAFSSILNYLNTLIGRLGSIAEVVDAFGGKDKLIECAGLLLTLASLIGIPRASVEAVGNGIIGKALTSPQLLAATAKQSGGSGGGSGGQQMMGLLNVFKGNAEAIKEIMSGTFNKEFINKNPRKYKQKKENEGKMNKYGDGRQQGNTPQASNPNRSYSWTGGAPQSNRTG